VAEENPARLGRRPQVVPQARHVNDAARRPVGIRSHMYAIVVSTPATSTATAYGSRTGSLPKPLPNSISAISPRRE
jgi:hypothetical protein